MDIQNTREYKAAKMGADDYRTDLRNKAAHELCKRIIESGLLDDTHLPFI